MTKSLFLTLCILVLVHVCASLRCINSCKGRADGDYQSCRSCHVYASCSNGLMYDNRPCAPGNPLLVWDDVAKVCNYQSNTCPEACQENTPNRCQPGYRLERGSCVQDCTSSGLGSTFINYPDAALFCIPRAIRTSVSRSNCQQWCESIFDCHSYTYTPDTGYCYITPCVPGRDYFSGTSPTFDDSANGSTLYVRNCKRPCPYDTWSGDN